MKSYDLSRNKLSGAIPPSISTLNYYSCLNLSFDLSGHIPSGNQLKTSDDKCIYIGNDGLCGHPMKSCPEDENPLKVMNELRTRLMISREHVGSPMV
ncbi:hypothetical protein OIU76_011451 [Salix suchowensis]|uniref:Uncharacterized protein n=1 Tax=Salix suchowensis TaxID=1278906 RepID=A0ABQ8ZXR8_9ROSI|nr:hypothetical protein OIU77_014407 [Salix suchowensis]KAJ6324155.1 hypothetical protein OIU76_011451 [Salix suchowensis]